GLLSLRDARVARRDRRPRTSARHHADHLMNAIERRRFLATLGHGGAALAAGSFLESIGYAQVRRGPSRAFIQPSRVRADLDRRVLGSFLEHLGRAIYTGVYEPGSPLSDARGFRTDVARDIKDIGVHIVHH